MEQIDRAERYLQRVRDIYSGVMLSSHDKHLHEDDLISFFMHCHHIRDWILHLNKIGVGAKQLDEFIDSNEALRVCADLCNGSKHCKLTRTIRSGRQPHVAMKEYKSSVWLTGHDGGEVLKGRYTILTASGSIDALELAEQSLRLWKEFIQTLEWQAP